jgi:protein SCO1/2
MSDLYKTVYVSRPQNRPAVLVVFSTLLLAPTLGLGVLLSTFRAAGVDHQDVNSCRLAVIKTAPDFTLTTQDGSKLSSSDLKGNVLLVSFIFTTCNGTCPATTHRMSQIQEELKNRNLLKDSRVRLLSISLDPARDTPEVLSGYMKLYDADPACWTFLTGPPDQVAGVVKSWGMWAKPAANGQLDHPSRIFLLDSQYRIREIYNLNFLKPKWVVQDMELLLKEAHHRVTEGTEKKLSR